MKQLALLLVLILPTICNAQVYKWVDENGKLHISTQPKPEAPVVDKKADVIPELTKSPELKKPIESNRVKPQPVLAPVKENVPVKTDISKANKQKKKATVSVTNKPAATKKVSTNKPKRSHETPARKNSKKAVKHSSHKKVTASKTSKKSKNKTTTTSKSKKLKVKSSKKTTIVKTKKTYKAPRSQAANVKVSNRNDEMCGVFTNYVAESIEKLANCSKNLCDIYKRQVERYKAKQQKYC